MRSPESQVLEAELMISSPEHVFTWLKRRSEVGEFWIGDDELEQSLLSRDSGLIDLGLARFGQSAGVVGKLFQNDTVPSRKKSVGAEKPSWPGQNTQKALRLAALGNRIHKEEWYSRMDRIPHILFDIRLTGDPERMREFMRSAEPDEIYALFSNPSIARGVLAELYEKQNSFDDLSEERWQELIRASIGNPCLQEEYTGAMDGWAESEHNSVFRNAWGLATTAPPTENWASLLTSLLQRTLPPPYFRADLTEIIGRWRVVPGRSTDGDSDPKNDSGLLDSYGGLRVLLGGQLDAFDDLRNDEDIAMRCAYYRFGILTPADLRQAYDKEPLFLLNNVLENEQIWRKRETRNALSELCRVQCNKPASDLHYRNYFDDRVEQWEKKRPDWFLKTVEVPNVESTMPEDLQRIKAIHMGLSELKSDISSLRRRTSMILLVALAFLAVFILRTC